MLACTQALQFRDVLLNSAIKARAVGVSEGKEDALISLARPNPPSIWPRAKLKQGLSAQIETSRPNEEPVCRLELCASKTALITSASKKFSPIKTAETKLASPSS